MPSRSERNAIRVPSGDQTGAESRQLPRVSSRRRVPAVSTIQMLLRAWSFSLSTQPREKTIWEPSGEMAALDTDSMSMKVSLSRTPCFACAAAGAGISSQADRTPAQTRTRRCLRLIFPLLEP